MAFRFRDAVQESIEQLKSHPRMGTLVPGSIPGLRSWPVKGFDAIRIYCVEGLGRLRVVRILHGKQEVRRILKREERGER